MVAMKQCDVATVTSTRGENIGVGEARQNGRFFSRLVVAKRAKMKKEKERHEKVRRLGSALHSLNVRDFGFGFHFDFRFASFGFSLGVRNEVCACVVFLTYYVRRASS